MKKNFIPFVLACMTLSACSQGWVDYPSGQEIEYVELSQTSASLSLGEALELTAIPSDDSATVTWLNSDSAVASLTANKKSATVIGLEAGKTTVSAISGGKIAQCVITVAGGNGEAEFTFEISENSKAMEIGDSFVLNATLTGRSDAIEWKTSNKAVATVETSSSTSCKISAVGEGTANITGRVGTKTVICVVTVEDPQATLSIHLNSTKETIEVDQRVTLSATVKPAGSTITWKSSHEDVATVENGVVTGKTAGTTTISASIKDEKDNIKSAQCVVTVTSKGGDEDYDEQIAQWSKPGHMYFHYLRPNKDYDKWALWLWPNYPNDGEGSLWGANHAYDNPLVIAQTHNYMSKADCGGVGTEAYSDQYGQIIDIDLTLTDVKGGKSGKTSPLIAEDLWDDALFAKAAIGFLIVDQTKMDGSDMWTSDGGAENYIKKIGKLMPEKKSSYFHVYATEGSVADFSTASGKTAEENPVAKDTTGKYRSHNDITNLKQDSFSNGVSTSSSFLADEPGVGYQIFVPSFADSDGDGYGDIQGIISKLKYLDDLGVKVLWLTPIQESNSYHGYDVTDYYKIDQRFGTLEDYQELIYKAHQRGMKVLMDMVINHTSKSNVLYKKSQKGVVEGDINYRDMYLWKYKGDKILEWNGVEAADPKKPYGPDNPAKFIEKNVEDSADWYRDGTSNYYYYGKFGSGMAELNYSSSATRKYMTDMCKYWLSFGLDGFRLDAIKHIYLLAELDTTYNYSNDYITYDVGYRTYYNDEMKKEVRVQNDYTYDRDLNVMFWKQFAGTIKAAYPNCFLVGENFDGWNARIAPFYEAIDSQFDFSTYYHLNESTHGDGDANITAMGGDITATLQYNNSYRGNSINGAFTSNHDIPRLLNHAAANSVTTHHAEVNSSNATMAKNRAKWFSAVTLLSPGLSWIYYGDELGLSGNTADKVKDSTGEIVDDHGNNVDRWYRQPMRWGKTYGEDMVVKYGFSGLEVLWDNYNKDLATVDEQEADDNSLLNYFQALGAAKADPRFPTYGKINWTGTIGGDASTLSMQLSDGSRTVNIFINATSTTKTISDMDAGTKIGGSYESGDKTVPAYGFLVVAK